MGLGNPASTDLALALTDMEQYILDTDPFLNPLSPVLSSAWGDGVVRQLSDFIRTQDPTSRGWSL